MMAALACAVAPRGRILWFDCVRKPPPLLAVGDTMRLNLGWQTYRNDVILGCERADLAPRARWTSSAPDVLAVDSAGLLRPLAPGRARITAAFDSGWSKAEFEVLPPVGSVRWVRRADTLRVGDTVSMRLEVRARNGQVLRTLPVMRPRGFRPDGAAAPGRPMAMR